MYFLGHFLLIVACRSCWRMARNIDDDDGNLKMWVNHTVGCRYFKFMLLGRSVSLAMLPLWQTKSNAKNNPKNRTRDYRPVAWRDFCFCKEKLRSAGQGKLLRQQI